MRKRTVRFGMHLLTAAISLIILATFFHVSLARLFSFSVGQEFRFIYLALGWGGAIGCFGIMVAAFGLFRDESRLPAINLIPSLLMLVAAIVVFFTLLFSSFHDSRVPDAHPGETVII